MQTQAIEDTTSTFKFLQTPSNDCNAGSLITKRLFLYKIKTKKCTIMS